jgi:hemerythrin superfamily protein
MKATLLLRKDHETLQALFARLRDTRGNDKTTLWEEIRLEILTHSSIEEELFYPELENTASIHAVELAAKARRQHQEIDELLEQISGNGPTQKSDDRMEQLLTRVEAHLSFEEDEIFEEARQTFSEFRMEQLGLEMEERRRFLGLPAA